MGAGHDHSHVTAGHGQRGRLALVLGISTTILAIEVLGGLLTGSLALLADAGHMFTDAAGVGLSLIAVTLAGRPANARRTFGLQRAEILAAAVNAVLLFAVGAFILVEAVRRIIEPKEIASTGMVVFAVVALLANTCSVFLLRSGQGESLNVRGAYLEVLSDAIGAGAVLVAAIVIAATGFTRADAVASLAIAVLILPRTWKLLREALHILIEATPKGIDLDDVREHILQVPGVVDVHDLHAWTITSGVPVLSAHVVVGVDQVTAKCGDGILDQLSACLGGHFDVEHCTFQLEPLGHVDHEHATHP
jgi:cobalt-zinc-cadmium efflux system protein